MEDLVTPHYIYQYYQNKKVFITGHTGFKGSWFITWLHLLGAKIKGYALTAKEKSLYNIVGDHVKFESVIADIRDKEKLQAEVTNFQPDFIFHFAAQPLVRRSYEIPAETFGVNTTGTANLLESIIALKNKCTVIIVTTDKVYEDKETDHYYKESDALGGYDPYSASKACSEMVTSSFRNSFFNTHKYDIHQKALATARAGNVIGGGDWNKDRIIPDIMDSLSKNIPVNVRNQNAIRPWQHVLEPLSGYLFLGVLLNENATQFSGAYNFGPEVNDHLSVKELVDIAISCWGRGTWANAYYDEQPHETGLLQLDISKAKNVLHWKPKLNTREAIEWTVEWYKQAGENRFEYTLQQIKSYQNR